MIKRKRVASLMSLAALAGVSAVVHAEDATDETLGVRVEGEAIPYAVWHVALMPGEPLDLEAPRGAVARVNGERIESGWVAPDESGVHNLTIENRWGQVDYRLSLFVLEPAANIDERGYLDGYRIGTYPADAPEGFIRLSPSDLDAPVSPHFNVGQFICKQQPDYFPKFLLVSPANLRRLETLLASLHEDELSEADTFFVMSGFRTPFYNTAIGSARLSRHMYGDAADVYLDVAPRDGVMDDVNGDGQITKADADFLYDYAEDLFADSDDVAPGGLGPYSANAVHGPFLHVDGRGHRARWGR